MQLSRKQVILISIVSGVVLLLTAAAALFLAPGEGEPVPEPTASPAQTDPPAATASPGPTPSPTAFRLPLVPQWDTPQPADPGDAAGAFVPQRDLPPGTAEPTGTAGPWVGAYDEHTKDILAVGLRNGRAAALLLMRLKGETLTILALPAAQTLLEGGNLEEQGRQAAALVERDLGMGYGAWLALDMTCLPAILEITGPLGSGGADVASPEGALALAADGVSCMQRVSLLKFPALKRAVGDGFASNLTTRELWSLFWTVRGGVTVRAFLPAPEEMVGGSQKYFGESS